MPTYEPDLDQPDRIDRAAPRGRRRRAPWLALSAVVVAALLGAACGDDDDDDAVPAADDAAAAGASSDTDAYCTATLAIETAGEPDIDFETATPEEMAEAAKAFVNETLQPLVDEMLADVPAEISDDIDVLAAAMAEIGETGDFTAFETPEVAAANMRVHAYDLEACGWESIDVEATDYAFAGLPDELEAGVVSFELANGGTDVHEIVLLKKGEGVTESFDELLELPEDEAEQKVTFLGVGGPVPAGETSYAVADLDPGEYLAICFIPVGMTAMDGPPPEGPPHFMSGMASEFTVS